MLTDLIHQVRQIRYEQGQARRLEAFYSRYKNATMVPKEVFSANLLLAERVLGVEGCVVECGVWKGGMTAGIAEVLGCDRNYYLFDSFEGLPPAKEIDGPAAVEWQDDKKSPNYFGNCTASLEQAEETMRRSPARKVFMIKGWFENTTPNCTLSSPIALLRLDGDWYDSTLICLTHLFPKVAKGGIVIIDDYYAWDGCAKAVHDFLSRNSLTERIEVAPPGVAFLTKRIS